MNRHVVFGFMTGWLAFMAAMATGTSRAVFIVGVVMVACFQTSCNCIIHEINAQRDAGEVTG